MRKEGFMIVGAVFTALLSTLCCLPAFLFLFFGISSGVLSYFTNLEYSRIPLVILTVIFLIFSFRNLKQKISCKCPKKEVYKQCFYFLIFFFVIVTLLLYPEFLPLFME